MTDGTEVRRECRACGQEVRVFRDRHKRLMWALHFDGPRKAGTSICPASNHTVYPLGRDPDNSVEPS